ncbi:MAG: acyl-CoA synthetase [Microbacterium sp. 14-71-5]|jgi:MFS family permease|uniref:acyl-CoA synthetase n=1 Tax=Microbacterium sp. 13-71-7 TaxID=1970399 RepID=UPI000BDD4EDC|nr:acyl-CoA synthetase [Microbacterium sp. 13-71-7]OZB84742.1 MAG: acyl-CoA synthetase [Microbacterium sp. 13-71-7]OZB88281.1 MAG: acyl-CoA synthetase [Microbacterium sp. 14-71-5]
MPATRTFQLRHVQLARAAFAAVAALMITFSANHSAFVGLAVFSGFALVTAVIEILAAWLVAPSGWRWPYVLLGAVAIVTGMASSIPGWRTTPLFFVVVIAWGALGGLVELLAGIRARRQARAGTAPAAVADGARDGILIGSLGLALAVGLLCVPTTYALNYSIAEAGSFTLTGITLAVGIFGAYAAIVAVFLGIAGLSPRARTAVAGTDTAGTAPAENEGSA